MGYKQGEIVLVPFPYSDLSGSKRRPVLIVSNDSYNASFPDTVVAVILREGVQQGVVHVTLASTRHFVDIVAIIHQMFNRMQFASVL